MVANSEKKVVIIGGGPSGAVAAKAMADRGYKVDLFEAYPHPSSLSKTSSKAYVIALSPRGQRSIENAIGMDPVTSIPGAIVSNTMARHGTKVGSAASVRDHSDQPSLIVPRQALVACLLDAAESSGVCIHFQQRLEGVDFEKRLATFVSSSSDTDTTDEDANAKKTTLVVKYDLLIGADGSNSKVRNLMADNLRTFTAHTEEDSMEYQVVELPNSPLPSNADFPEGTVHVWNNKEYNSLCLAFPSAINDNHGMMLAIVFPEGKLASFQTSGYQAALGALLHDVGETSLREMEKQLRENQIANGGLCVWPSSLGSDGVILLGDSGHGMWPSLGQGANCALESAAVFTCCLDSLPVDSSDWTGDLLLLFQTARFDDATAAVNLTYGGIGSRTSRGRQNAPLSFKLQIVGIMLLHKLTFGIVPKPALLQLMGGSQVSYSRLHKYHFYYEKMICLGASLFTVAATVVIHMMWSQSKAGAANNSIPFGGNDGL